MSRVRWVAEDGTRVASVWEAMHGAESVAELYDFLLWAKATYSSASRGTIRKWEREAERLAARLRVVERPGIVK